MPDNRLQALIESLCEEYTEDAARELESYGETAIHPLLDVLWRTDVDPYGHDTFAEILVNVLLGARYVQTVDILVSLLEHENADVRRRAIAAMGDSGDRRALYMLRIALYDRNDLVQQSAAQALIKLQYGSDSLHAYKTALYNSEARVRYYAVRQLEYQRATDILVEATYNEDATIRQIAVWYLGRVRAPQALPALIDAVQDHEIEVRGGAAWALGNLGSTRAIPALLPLLNDPEAIIVQLASDALDKLGYAPTA